GRVAADQGGAGSTSDPPAGTSAELTGRRRMPEMIRTHGQALVATEGGYGYERPTCRDAWPRTTTGTTTPTATAGSRTTRSSTSLPTSATTTRPCPALIAGRPS